MKDIIIPEVVVLGEPNTPEKVPMCKLLGRIRVKVLFSYWSSLAVEGRIKKLFLFGAREWPPFLDPPCPLYDC